MAHRIELKGFDLPSQQERLNIAVFIDFDNIEIGVRTTLGQQFDVGTILEAIKERGEVITKIAYADWTRAGEYSRALTQHAIRLVQRNLTPGGDKNGADINLALDALEMAFTHQHINAYVIVGGDSDFLSLVEKLKQYDKKVFVVGGRAFTSVILQRNCHEFIAYENLSGVRRAAASAASKGGRPVSPPALSPVTQAFPIVRRALKILADREVSPQTGLLKSTLLQLDSTFSERNYGASSFLDFTEKLAHSGLVHLKTAGRSVMVELNPSFEDGGEGADQKTRAAADEAQPATPETASAAPADAGRSADQYSSPAPAVTESAADGVRFVSDVLQKATSARWPMYIRNVKQLLRAADSGFDERRYGFGGLMDLLRACQRDGVMRLERDRRGGLRVFPGAALQRPAGVHVHPPAESSLQAESSVDAEVDEGAGQPLMPIETEPADVEGNVIDTTAELLGRAKPRRPRAKAPAGPAPRKTARPSSTAGPRRPPARRTARSKKAAADSGDDN
jgi:uncharacterized LabA/DUF88 family protein